MNSKRFLFQFSRNPADVGLAVQEGVEAALMAVAFEQSVTLLFRAEGRLLLDDESMALVPGLAELLELAREIWVETNGARAPANTKPAEAAQCVALLSDYPVVMQF